MYIVIGTGITGEWVCVHVRTALSHFGLNFIYVYSHTQYINTHTVSIQISVTLMERYHYMIDDWQYKHVIMISQIQSVRFCIDMFLKWFNTPHMWSWTRFKLTGKYYSYIIYTVGTFLCSYEYIHVIRTSCVHARCIFFCQKYYTWQIWILGFRLYSWSKITHVLTLKNLLLGNVYSISLFFSLVCQKPTSWGFSRPDNSRDIRHWMSSLRTCSGDRARDPYKISQCGHTFSLLWKLKALFVKVMLSNAAALTSKAK